jgi:hypothetical protein
MVRFHQLPLLAGLVAPFALASPRSDAREPTWTADRTIDDGLVKRDLIIPRGPKAPMIRRNGLAVREETKAFSLEQTLENEIIFNR